MTRTEHLLTILAEECAEVAQRAAKAIRFGLNDTDPEGRETGTAAEKLVAELNDLFAVVATLAVDGVIPDTWLSPTAVRAKQAKVAKFLEYSAKCGTLSGEQGP